MSFIKIYLAIITDYSFKLFCGSINWTVIFWESYSYQVTVILAQILVWKQLFCGYSTERQFHVGKDAQPIKMSVWERFTCGLLC